MSIEEILSVGVAGRGGREGCFSLLLGSVDDVNTISNVDTILSLSSSLSRRRCIVRHDTTRQGDSASEKSP